MQEVLVELNRQNQAKQDFISPAQGMRLREDGQTFEINHLTTSQQEVFGTTSLFHRQVASALGTRDTFRMYTDMFLTEYIKAAEEAKKAEAESVVKKLLASGMSADEILEKLK